MRPLTFSQVKPAAPTFLGNGQLTERERERLTLIPEKPGRYVISPILLIIAAIVLFFMIKAR